jgi:hypothetical protein
MALDGRESRGLKHADVLGDGGQRHVEVGGELADRAVAGRQAREDFAAGRVGERMERGVEVDG